MDLKQMQYFVKVCELQSIAGAADALYISRQGLNMSILRMEEELGCKLFTRTQKGVKPTDAGEYFLPRAKNILREYAQCEDYFRGTRQKRETLTLYSAMGAMSEFGNRLVNHFSKEFPSIEVSVVELPDYAVDEKIKSGVGEIAYGTSPVNEEVFERIPLFSSKICMVVKQDHPYAQYTMATIDMLRDTPFFIIGEHCKVNEVVTSLCTENGFSPIIPFETTEVCTVHRLVQEQGGVGVAVESYSRSAGEPDLVILPFREPRMVWSVSLIWRRGAELSRAANAFRLFSETDH